MKVIRTLVTALVMCTTLSLPQVGRADPTGYGEMVVYGENLRGSGAGGELSELEFWYLVEVARLYVDWFPSDWPNVPREPGPSSGDDQGCDEEQQAVYDKAMEIADHMSTFPEQPGFPNSPNPSLSILNFHKFRVAGWISQPTSSSLGSLLWTINHLTAAIPSIPDPAERAYFSELVSLLNELVDSLKALGDCLGAPPQA